MPKKNAPIPMVFCSTMFPIAYNISEPMNNWLVSETKVEKVVKAPRNPTRITMRIWLLTPQRSLASPQTIPNSKHPKILTTTVPQGNPTPLQR